jgi:serine/threonine protein kinase/tetratricopeptide (TPR) repeat protein
MCYSPRKAGEAVNTESREPVDEPATELESVQQEVRICPVCGSKFTNSKFCLVCILRSAAGGESLVSDPADVSEDIAKGGESTPPGHRFESYELMLDAEGRPLELGRGAMGITYKALDVDLRCPVTLKVINERYLGDESVRLRFLREARAAASVRHANVASVFHLGRTGKSYFYAMEFVEGETLESLIKRRGRLDVKLALEITAQVAAGLAAVHKQKLVHRDIKPSNIMVHFEEGGAMNAKIIDLGLAKASDEPSSQTAISMPGAFVGTPEFASPEQFEGAGLDIRSDLYSLGVTLWRMLTGESLFRGSLAEVMYQHRHGRLPLEQLKFVPLAVVTLIEALVEKDPTRRFQGPAELLRAIQTVTGAIERGPAIQSVQKPLTGGSGVQGRQAQPSRGPEKISVSRLPITGSDVFGREEDVAFLDDAWGKPHVNVVAIVAWAGVGKSTLVNHWLGCMSGEHYRSAELVFGWSFYRQGTSGQSSSADEFLEGALTWFGDPDPRIGTAWEKGERLAKLITHRRTLLILDGLEPLQNPPGPQEGRLREPSLQALLRELAAFNAGLCVITTRMPVADIAEHERTSAPRRDLDHLSREAGAKLLQALGVKGSQTELRSASDEFSGHCLALALLGSYLTDAYNGDIRCRTEVSDRLAHDVRQGVHARKVMESYKTWLGEGPELSVLRMLGLFDRPADEKALEVLLKPPVIRGLTASLKGLSPTEWRTILARLRRTRLLAGEDPQNPGHLDTHPLVREYFGEQLRIQKANAWKECNRRLYNYYRALAPQLPESFGEMEPLFLASICGCNAGLYRETLHQIYIPRIQRGTVCFAANVLGARGALLTVLSHFFEHGRWGSLVGTAAEGQRLTPEDQLFVLMQAALYLTATRGMGAPEARICYERAASLSNSLADSQLQYRALMGQWRYSLFTDKGSATLQIAERIYSLAEKQNNSAGMVGGYIALACTHHFLGDFETAHDKAMRAVQIWRSGAVRSHLEEPIAAGVASLWYQALSEWHFGQIAVCHATMAEAISVAGQMNDMHGLAAALFWAAVIGQYERNPAEVERLAADLIARSMSHNFPIWLAMGAILRGWAQSASGDAINGASRIEAGIRDFRATGSIAAMPYFLALKAEALYLADRTSAALEAIREAQVMVERFEERWWLAELHRLRGVFLAAAGASEFQILASFGEAIRIAKEQKSVSLEKRAEGTYAKYRRRKATGSGGSGFRLPLGNSVASG